MGVRIFHDAGQRNDALMFTTSVDIAVPASAAALGSGGRSISGTLWGNILNISVLYGCDSSRPR